MQAESTIQKGVEEWNPKEDPHAQVQLLTYAASPFAGHSASATASDRGKVGPVD